MYISIKKIIEKFNLKVKGVVHIGGCKGEELFSYFRSDIKDVILIEANPDLIKNLKIKKFFYKYFLNTNICIENFAAYDVEGIEMNLNITNNLQSSSVLDLHKHSELYPTIIVDKKTKVKTETINNIFKEKYNIDNYNFLNLDIQGAELKALQGSTEILPFMDAIYTEINFEELYKGCPLANELDLFLKEFKFQRVLTKTPDHPSWGDALYLKI